MQDRMMGGLMLDRLVSELPFNLRLLLSPLVRGFSQQERDHIEQLLQTVITARDTGDTDTLLRLRAEFEPQIPAIFRPLLDKYLSEQLLPPQH